MNNGTKDASLHFKEAFERLYERSPFPKILHNHFEVQKNVTSSSHNAHGTRAFVSPLARTVTPPNVCQKIFQSLQHAQSDHNDSAIVSDSDQSCMSEKSCDDICPKLSLNVALKRSVFRSPQAHIDGSLKRAKRDVDNTRNYSLENLHDGMSPKIPVKDVIFSKVNLVPVSSKGQEFIKQTKGINDALQKNISAIVDDRIQNLHWSSEEGNDCSTDSTIQYDNSIIADNSMVQNEADSGSVCLQQLTTENGERVSRGFGTELNIWANSTVNDNCSNKNDHNDGSLNRKVKSLKKKKYIESDSDSVVKVTRRSLQKKGLHACSVITDSDDDVVSNEDHCQKKEIGEGQKKCHIQGEETHVETDDDKGIKLYKWLIKSIPEVGGICVAGHRNLDDSDLWQSLEVVERLDRFTVATKSGFQYNLIGAMDIEEALSGGFSDEVIEHFLEGFPDNWEELIENFYQMENGKLSQEQFQDTKDSDSDEDTVLSRVSHITDHDLDTDTDVNQTTCDISDNVKSNNVSECTLYDWIIKPLPKWQGICIEGKKRDSVDEEEFWHSSLISERVNSHTVKSMSGSVYRLVGDIDRHYALEAGFSSKIVNAFKKGFPFNWLEVIERHYHLDSTRMKTSPKVARSVNKKRPKKENDLNDTVCTPLGRFVTIDNLEKTRSGRTVKPALAWWAGQRIKTDHETNQVRVVHATVYAEKTLAEMAQDFLNIPKQYSSYKDNPSAKKKTTSRNTSLNSSKRKNPQQHKTNKKGKDSIQEKGSENMKAEKTVEFKKSKQKCVSERKDDRKTCYPNQRKTVHSKGKDVSEISKEKKATQNDHKRPSKTGNVDLTKGKYHLESQAAGTEDRNTWITRSLSRTADKSRNYQEQSSSSSKEDGSSLSVEDGNDDTVVQRNYKTDKKVDVSVKENSSDDENLNLDKTVMSILKKSKRMRQSERRVHRKTCYEAKENLNANNSSSVVPIKNVFSIDVNQDEMSKKNKTTLNNRKKSSKTDNVDKSLKKDRFKDDSKSETAFTEDVNVRITRSQSKTVCTRVNYQEKRYSEEETNDHMFVQEKTMKTSRRKQKGKGRKNNVISTRNGMSKIMPELEMVETRDIQNGQTSWTKNEIECLYEAVACVRPDDNNFWSFVAQKVKTKSEKECQEYYYKEIPEKKKRTKNSNKTSADKASGQKPQIGRVGTLKRKRHLRNLIDNFNKGYEDDLFDATPYRSRSHTKIQSGTGHEMDVFEEFGKDYTEELKNIHTPVTRFFRLPMSERRTPVSSTLDEYNGLDREEADKYMQQLKKKKCLDKHPNGIKGSRSSKNVSATPVAKKKKTNSWKSLGDLFAEEDTLTDNSEDSEADYYWSDAENK